MKRFFAAALLVPALFVACSQAPTPEVKPPVLEQPPFKPSLLGSLTVEFGVDGKGTSAQFKPSAIQNQALSPVTESTLTFTNQIFQTIDVPASTDRYLMARFTVTNTSASPRTNLTLVAYRKNNNSGGSAFTNVQTFAGGTVNVNNLVPINAMKTTGCTAPATVCVDNANADLQIFTRSEIATLTTDSNGSLINVAPTTGEGILQYAYVARSSATSRTIAANNGTGTVTLALQVPQAGDAGSGNSAYRYSMTFLVFTDNVARVTESTSEQGTGSGAATRATSFGGSPQIATMCGTTLTGSTFIPGVRTVGVGVDTAWMGGNFFDNTGTAANFTGIIGNTEKAYTGSNASLTARFSSLGGATLTPQNRAIGSATTTNGGNLGIDNSSTGTVTIRPKVNSRVADGFTYQISDGTCTSPNIAATVAAPSNTVWYIDSAAAAGGDGRSNSPFQTLASLNVGASPDTVTANNDFIYVKGNSSNTATLALKSGQQLIGAGVALVVGADTLQTAGTAPTITNPVTVPTTGTNTISGMTFASISSGASFGTLNISSASLAAGAAQAINLTGGALTVSLTSVSSSGGTNNIALTNTTGTFSITGTGTTAGSGGTLSGATGDGIVLATQFGTVALSNINLSNSGLNGINATPSTGTNSLTLAKVAVTGAGATGANQETRNGLRFDSSGSSNSTITVGTSSFNTSKQFGVKLASGGTGSLSIDVQNNTFGNNVDYAVWVWLVSSGTNKFLVNTNTITNTVAASGGGIRVWGEQSTALQSNGRINSNTIGLTTAASTSVTGIDVETKRSADVRVEVNNNTVSGFRNTGINIITDSTTGTASKMSLKLTNNTLSSSATGRFEGMQIISGASFSPAPQPTLCLNMSGNKTQAGDGAAGFPDNYYLWQFNGVFQVQGLAANSTTPFTAMNTLLLTTNTNQNQSGGAATIQYDASTTFNPALVGGCTAPSGV
jgi:trimeric autotransporter adhesin